MKKFVSLVLTALLSCVGSTGYAAAPPPTPPPAQTQPFAPARPYAGMAQIPQPLPERS